MSVLARSALRTVVRSAPRRPQARAYSASQSSGYAAELAAKEAHARETTDLWRKISYYVCIPGIIVCSVWVYNVEKEHTAHEAHAKEENGGVRPQPPAYDYLNRRVKPFPWGNNSLFYNSEVNKNMDE